MDFTKAEKNFILMALTNEGDRGLDSCKAGIMPIDVFIDGIALIASIADKLRMEG